MADKQITKWDDEEVVTLLTPDMDKAESIQQEFANQRAEYYARYRMALYGNERDGFSKSVAPVVFNNHTWTMANLMDIFNDDFFVLKGEDEDRTSKFQKLIYYQMFRKQDGFRKFFDLLFTAGLYHYCVAKVHYKEDFDLEYDTYDRLTADEMMQLAQDQSITVSKYDEVQDETGATVYEKVKVVKKVMNYAGPCLEVIPNWEFFYSADCKMTDWGGIEGRLVYQKTKRTLNDIRKREKAGIYRKGTFEKIKAKGDQTTPDSYDKVEVIFNADSVSETVTQEPSNDPDNILSREVEIKECYYRLDIDGDGLLEPVIIDLCDDVVCRLVENEYKRPCFRLGHVAPEPHKIQGFSRAALLDNDQKIMTNLLRLIQDSAALDCYKNPVTNDHQMFTMLQDRKPFAVIKGDPQKLGEVKTSPPSPFVLQAWELMKAENEQKTGITRYNQGQDASSLNKMLDIHTLVPMADGYWKTMGTVVSGDMVIGRNGQPTRVVTAHPIDLPERAYNITFKSGEVIKAGGEHLWTIQTTNDRRYDKEQTVNTDALFELFHTSKCGITIPRVERPQFDGHTKLPVDPYILGLWLGDGHSYNARITTEDQDIIDYVRSWAESKGGSLNLDSSQSAGHASTYSITGTGLHAALRKMKLAKRGGANNDGIGKHIPGVYLRSSYENRLALLRGLMDTDGCHHSGALVIFTQKEGALVDDIMQLIEGLGGWPSKCITEPGLLAREGVKYYNVNLSIADNPFLLKKKADKWQPPQRGNTRQCILSIEPTDIIPMRCLTVDAPDHLFCVGQRFTVTSNTATGISAIFAASGKPLRLVARILGNGLLLGIIRDFIFINQKWPPEQDIRILGTDITVNPADLYGAYEIEIDIGVSEAEKNAMANQIDLLIQFGTQAGLQMGIMTPIHIIKAQLKKYRLLGQKIDDLMLNPQEFEKQQAQKQQQPPPPNPEAEQAKAQMQMEQQKMQMEMQTEQSKLQMEQQSKQMEMQMAQAETQQKLQQEQALFNQKLRQNEELHNQKMRQESERIRQQPKLVK
jgi:hypothetical protein